MKCSPGSVLQFSQCLDVPDALPEVIFFTSISDSSYIDTCWVQNFSFTKKIISPSKISRENAGVIITISWVWLIFRQLRQLEFVEVWKHIGRVMKELVSDLKTFTNEGCKIATQKKVFFCWDLWSKGKSLILAYL